MADVDVEAGVKSILSQLLCVDETEIKPTTLIRDELGADSLGMVEIAMGLEEEFGIHIKDSDGDGVRTVQDAVDLVEKMRVK